MLNFSHSFLCWNIITNLSRCRPLWAHQYHLHKTQTPAQIAKVLSPLSYVTTTEVMWELCVISKNTKTTCGVKLQRYFSTLIDFWSDIYSLIKRTIGFNNFTASTCFYVHLKSLSTSSDSVCLLKHSKFKDEYQNWKLPTFQCEKKLPVSQWGLINDSAANLCNAGLFVQYNRSVGGL